MALDTGPTETLDARRIAMTEYVLTDEELFCLEGCRSYKQYHQMRRSFEQSAGDETEHCIFCHLNLKRNKVLWEDKNAMMWHCPEDYFREELRLHILVVPKRHVRFEADLTDEEVLSIHHAKQFARNKFGYQGGLTHVREGPMQLNAGTVRHLHYNTFEPDPEAIARIAAQSEGDKKVEVRVPVYKDPRDREENRRRAAGFAARYEAGEPPN